MWFSGFYRIRNFNNALQLIMIYILLFVQTRLFHLKSPINNFQYFY